MTTRNPTSVDRKIDNILDSLEKHSSLTADGRAWLIAACDIFHDTDIQIAGYPDVNTSATVAQLIKKQIQIAAPTGIVGNWDASIVMFPTLASITIPFINTLNNFGQITASAALANGFFAGGLVINSGATGGNLWPNSTTNAVAPANFTSTFVDIHEYAKGDVRIIGMGFEVVNTTAALTKQGQVTAYRMPTVPTLTEVSYLLALSAGNTVGFAAQPFYNHRFPPSTIADAQLLYGSRSWAAAEGSYTVCRQNSEENRLQSPDYIQDGYFSLDSNIAAGNFMFSTNQPGFAGFSGKPADIHAPFDLSGVHYTGLSPTTTLTVNVRWLIERSPSPQEPDIVVLATPSAAYDPLALELYTHCIGKMPPGVMLSENSLGDWFRSALSTVQKWAPKVGDFVGNFVPGAQLVGGAIGRGAEAVHDAFGRIRVPPPLPPRPALVGSASTTNTKPLKTLTMVGGKRVNRRRPTKAKNLS